MFNDWWFWVVLFLGVVTHWLLPVPRRATFLAVLSFAVLLAYDIPSALVVVAFVLAFYYLAPRSIGNRYAGTWLLTISVLAYLAFFKYFPPLVDAIFGDSPLAKIALPLGISFLTFKLLHYLIEIRRNRIPQHGIDDFACYMLLFPIFTAGPIERFDHFLTQRESTLDRQMIAEGLMRIVFGLIKKFVIADTIIVLGYRGLTIDSMVLNIDRYGTHTYWRFMIVAFLYTYMDFSAYSDIAIGASRLFGIRIMENFNWPIFASNIGVFWKRWHMTLAMWCQTYVYMPTIGLTRRPLLAVYSTFLVMGLWHAASIQWIGWGLYQASGIMVFLVWLKLKRKHNWRFEHWIYRLPAIGLTMLFVSAGASMTLMHGHATAYETLRVMAKLLFIVLPA